MHFPISHASHGIFSPCFKKFNLVYRAHSQLPTMEIFCMMVRINKTRDFCKNEHSVLKSELPDMNNSRQKCLPGGKRSLFLKALLYFSFFKLNLKSKLSGWKR